MLYFCSNLFIFDENQKVESGSNPNPSANETTNTNLNGTLNALPAAVSASSNNNAGGPALSQFSLPSTATSFSPTRFFFFTLHYSAIIT